METSLAFEQTDQDLVAPLLDAQEQRWARGECVTVEQFVTEHAVLRGNPSAVLCLILNEYSLRQARGESPTCDEYEQRFPELGAELRLQLLVHENLSALADSVSEGLAERTFVDGGLPASRLPAPPGYELLTELGRGGMGVVYRARQKSVNRLVALKMLRGGGGEQHARFRVEAEAMAKLQHPNVVGVHDYGEHAGHCFLAMELVEGGDLAERLQKGPLPPRQAADLVEKLACAAQAAHDQGLIHRDLTPRNVLFARDGRPRITDFGLVKLIGGVEPKPLPPGLDARLQAVSEGLLRGTPPYMAPEQARGAASEIAPATDVYALEPKLGESCFVLGAALLIRQRNAEAAVALELSVRCFRSQLDRTPSALAVRTALSKAYYHLSEAQRRLGKLEIAAGTTFERMKLWPKHADETYDAACELARCAAAIDARPTPRSPADQRERQRYADQAMDTLKKAVELGLTRLEEVGKDADLKPLHDRADFQALFLKPASPK